MPRILVAACLALPTIVLAQPEEEPLQLEGATIRGEQELPIGLYITPWRNSAPEEGIEKPARLLQEALVPIDPPAFRRERQYWQALESARQSAQQIPDTSPQQ